MKIRERWKKGCALAFVLFLMALPCLVKLQTWAAVAIDVGRTDCTITVDVSGSDFQEDFDEMRILVSLYKVADVDAVGRYTAVGAFSGMDFGGVSDKTTAEDWMRLAEEAAGYLGISAGNSDASADAGAAAGGSVGTRVEPVDTVYIEKAEGSDAARATFEGLETGLYLVVPQETFNPDYTVKYVFTPYLTALPSSDYTLSGAGSDDWNYDTEIGLKAEAEQQYGKLTITKTLSNYNETLGRTSFVFLIEGRDETNTVVYSNVISTTHEGAGSETVTLGSIPAGLTVTVTEVYSGASYTIVGSDTDSALIWSDAAVDATAGTPEAVEQAAVSFTNRYDGGNRGGYGVTNHFESDGDNGWIWENPTE